MRQREAYDSVEVKGLTVKIYADDSPSSPREDDNLGTMVCWHRNYRLGDKHEFKTPDDFKEWLEDKANGVAICLPLFLYDHSGITMNTTGFSCPWDSGQVGCIYITREKMKSEYSAKRISKKLTERVTKYLVQEVETYNQFLTGDIYGYEVEDAEGNHLDSCWGFYGMDSAKQEGTQAAEYEAKKIADVDASIDKTFAL